MRCVGSRCEEVWSVLAAEGAAPSDPPPPSFLDGETQRRSAKLFQQTVFSFCWLILPTAEPLYKTVLEKYFMNKSFQVKKINPLISLHLLCVSRQLLNSLSPPQDIFKAFFNLEFYLCQHLSWALHIFLHDGFSKICSKTWGFASTIFSLITLMPMYPVVSSLSVQKMKNGGNALYLTLCLILLTLQTKARTASPLS